MLIKLKTALRALLRKSQAERELDEELRYHIERQTEQNIRLGMSPEEARYAALKAFGGVEQAKERSRDSHGMRWVEELWQDLRYGARMLVKNPSFTLVAALTLALGIGANTAIFSVVNGALLKPLPYEESERLVFVAEQAASSGQEPISYPNFTDWRAQNRAFEHIGVFNSGAYTLTVGGEDAKDPVVTVVGSVGRVKMEEPSRESNRVQGYFPFLQFPLGPTFIVRARTSPEALMAAVRRQVREVDPLQPISDTRSLEQIRNESIARERFILALVGSFAAIAFILAMVGIYSLTSYSVTRRTREIGIRMALGAQAGDVRRLVVRQGLALALAGVAIGLAGAFALTRMMKTLLFEVSATDPLTFASIAALLTTMALLACYLPARRATKVDPMVALRCD